MTPESIPHDRFAGAEPVDDWPEPMPLRDELPSVRAFDSNLLPSQLRPWVQDIAERMNCPMDLVAIPAIIAAGSLIGRRVGIRPQRRTNWQEVGNLWGCVVARPGSLKSPAATEALAPLRRLEARVAEEYQVALARHKAAESLFKLEREDAEKCARATLKDKGKVDPRGAALNALTALAEPALPIERRFLTSDVTAEKLGEICAANPNGIMVHRDELLSLFSDLDQSEKASARGFFLTGWSGMDGYTFDRIMRGTVRVPAVNVSIFGTTQPSRLASYVRDSLKRFDDGMVQRLQLLVWPDIGRKFRDMDQCPDAEARRLAYQCYDRLAVLDPAAVGARRDEFDGPDAVPYLRFVPEAQDAFSAWRGGLEHRLHDPDIPSHFAAHLAKYRGLLPRLALICHLASDGTGPVSLAAFQMAKGWISYLELHAQRVYASTEVDDAEAARAIWQRVKKEELGAPFTSRDIQRRGWSKLKDRARIRGGLEALVDAEWLRTTTVETGGRPSILYMPNPKAARL